MTGGLVVVRVSDMLALRPVTERSVFLGYAPPECRMYLTCDGVTAVVNMRELFVSLSGHPALVGRWQLTLGGGHHAYSV